MLHLLFKDDCPPEKEASKAHFAGMLAESFQKEEDRIGSQVFDEELDSSGNPGNNNAQVTFLRRIVPWWYMKPLKSKDGGAMRKGTANEDQIIKSLGKYITKFSAGKYKLINLQTYGLLARRDVRSCSSSPDGVFGLLEKQSHDTFKYIGLSVLEIKTRSALGTVSVLYKQSLDGNNWVKCQAGTPLFKEAVPDPAYRSQLCQHATALDVQYVVMVYSVPGGLPMKIVLVEFSKEQRHTLVTLQQLIADKYLSFCYDDQSHAELPELGEDYSSVYGYAQTHETLELWLGIWKAHDADVRLNGTPPAARRFIDMPTMFWNKCMGNVDTVRKVIRDAMPKHGSTCGPGSLLWFVLFDYILYNAFRHYQHGQVESKLDSFESFRQFQHTRTSQTSFRMCLRRLSKYDLGLNSSILDDYFPGRKEQVDRMKSGQEHPSSAISPNSVRLLSSVVAADAPIDVESDPPRPLPTKKILYSFLDNSQPWFHKRLDTTLCHMRVKSSRKCNEKTVDGDTVVRSIRGNCILCCSTCDKHSTNPRNVKHTRRGRYTVMFCGICQVYLCKICWDTFHNDPIPCMPPCIDEQLGFGPRRELRYKNLSTLCSPVRTVIRKVAPIEEQHVIGTSAARRVIGVKSRERRLASVPAALTVTTPTLVASPMKIVRKIRGKQGPRLRANILAVQRPGFRGAKRKTILACRTGDKRLKKCARAPG
jgi:hypothetical protein